MDWEFAIALVIALLGLGVSVFFLRVQPFVSAALIVGVWLGLVAVVARLERRERRRERLR